MNSMALRPFHIYSTVMMILHMNRWRLPVAPGMLSFAMLAFGSSAPCAAEDFSRWDGDARSSARLIAGARTADVPYRAGIEIKLKAGWHTYWRYPGDAGVPPQFDFTGSQNLKAVEVRWPAPRRIVEAGLVAIGYDRDVILPLVVTPQDKAKPVALRLKLNYAICEKLCVPADAKLDLVLAGTPGRPAPVLASAPSTQDVPLAAAEARVPKQRALGEGDGLAVRSVRRDGGDHPHLVVEVAAVRSGPVDLFAEGPTDQWALPLPVATPGATPPLQRFVIELDDGAPPGEKYEGALITLTAVQDGEAIEVKARID
jgi:DsbC/DsbD-like thiol-disulfide interchange protein